VVRGEVEMETNDVLEPDDLADGLILACQSQPVTDEVEVSYD
jgi:3-ketosteroid 9alpha-monooxygenase subunit B